MAVFQKKDRNQKSLLKINYHDKLLFMSSLKSFLLLSIMIAFYQQSQSQQIQISKEQLIALTPLWKGERFADGRPKAPDSLIDRLKKGYTRRSMGGVTQ